MEKKLVEANELDQAFKMLQKKLAEAEKANAKLAKENAVVKDELVKAQSSGKEAPVGYLDIWSDQSATLRFENTEELAKKMVANAKANDGIGGMSLSFQKAPNTTTNAMASYQVFGSHVRTYDEDNALKEEKGIAYRNRKHSMLQDGRQVHVPRELRKSA
tara:strand:+ start:25344 stop:25823 length:480 start_codon:yes stop_codon:yes gene_type:complete